MYNVLPHRIQFSRWGVSEEPAGFELQHSLMSQATKKKHVAREVLEEYPELLSDQKIVRISNPRGNNLHEVEGSSGEHFLCSMPTKFRKNVWIKRGDFVIVEPIEEGEKVKAEIVHILFSEQIKHLKKIGKWPESFSQDNTKLLDEPSMLDSNEEEDSDKYSEEEGDEASYDEYGNSTQKSVDEDEEHDSDATDEPAAATDGGGDGDQQEQ